jgi:glycosyltransferase involved in cell wall biosynthesis
VLNDGYPKSETGSTKVIDATRFSRSVEKRSTSTFGSILKFCYAQIAYCVAILKHLRHVKLIFVFPITMYLPMLLCKLLGKKVVLYEAQDIWSENTGQGILSHLRFHLLLQARSAALYAVDHMIVEGEKSIEVNRIMDRKHMISILPQFVDANQYTLGDPATKKGDVVTFVGTLDYRKGAMLVVEAAVSLIKEREGVKFNIIGEGPLKDPIRDLIDREGFADKITLRQKLSENAFQEILTATKICLLPSIAEGLPNIVLESMASGIIVVVTPVGAIPNLIQDGKTGFLLRELSPRHIADRIIDALDDPNLEIIRKTARLVVEREYSYSIVSGRYKRFLKRLFSE